MDKNKAHDILHTWNGGKAQNCPVCNGTVQGDDAVIEEARKVADDNFRPMLNPTLPMDQTMYMDENGGGVDTTPDTKPPTPKKMSEISGIMTDVMSFSEDSQNLPSRIKIIPTGTFNTQAYGEVKISKDDLLEMADNFKKGVRAGVPIDIDHDQKAAAGWINEVEVSDDGMYANVEWTKLGEDKLSTKEYRFFSPEFAQSYIDPEHSHELSNVLIAGSLVNRPMFKELPAIAGSEDGVTQQNLTNQHAPLMLFITNTKDTQNYSETTLDNQSNSLLEDTVREKPMDLQAILAKEKSTRTSDEQQFVAASLDKLTDEQKIAEGFVVNPVTASETKVEDTPATTTPDDNNPAKGEQTIAAKEQANNVVISASEYQKMQSELQTLKTQAEQGTLAFKELQKKDIADKVRSFQFNEKGGKIAPAQVEPIVNLMVTMSEPQRAELTKIIEALPDRKIFGEMGSDEDLDKSRAADILTAKAQELVKGGMTFSEAYRKVVRENPDLYQESLKPASKSDL